MNSRPLSDTDHRRAATFGAALVERPIQVGDSVQLDTLMGTVKDIGIRASIVRTFEGAEVLVPNADLIAGRVVNWTLSDRLRRLEIKVLHAQVPEAPESGGDVKRDKLVVAPAREPGPGAIAELGFAQRAHGPFEFALKPVVVEEDTHVAPGFTFERTGYCSTCSR